MPHLLPSLNLQNNLTNYYGIWIEIIHGCIRLISTPASTFRFFLEKEPPVTYLHSKIIFVGLLGPSVIAGRMTMTL